MGRTVINETENKQTVILNDSPEGIEGGYFDADMVWHEIGGDTPPMKSPNGEKEFSNGAHLSINNNHVEFSSNGASSQNGFNLILDNVFRNDSTIQGNVTGCRNVAEIKQGDVIKTHIYNIVSPAAFTLNIRYSSSFIELLAGDGTTTEKENTVTFTASDNLIKCVYLYLQNTFTGTISFDIEIFKNGDRLL